MRCFRVHRLSLFSHTAQMLCSSGIRTRANVPATMARLPANFKQSSRGLAKTRFTGCHLSEKGRRRASEGELLAASFAQGIGSFSYRGNRWLFWGKDRARNLGALLAIAMFGNERIGEQRQALVAMSTRKHFGDDVEGSYVAVDYPLKKLAAGHGWTLSGEESEYE